MSHIADRRGQANARIPNLGQVLALAFDTVLTWQERARQRRLLMSFDERMLADIGIGPAEAEAEFRKRPWHP